MAGGKLRFFYRISINLANKSLSKWGFLVSEANDRLSGNNFFIYPPQLSRKRFRVITERIINNSRKYPKKETRNGNIHCDICDDYEYCDDDTCERIHVLESEMNDFIQHCQRYINDKTESYREYERKREYEHEREYEPEYEHEHESEYENEHKRKISDFSDNYVSKAPKIHSSEDVRPNRHQVDRILQDLERSEESNERNELENTDYSPIQIGQSQIQPQIQLNMNSMIHLLNDLQTLIHVYKMNGNMDMLSKTLIYYYHLSESLKRNFK